MEFPRRIYAQRTSRSSQPCLATKSEPCLTKISSRPQFSKTEVSESKFDYERDAVESPQETCGAMRLMLFRECDTRGRKLLYDSAAQKGNRKQLQLLEDMVFGSAALNFYGDTAKVHDFSREHWEGYNLMLTKIFLAQPVSLPPQALKKHQSYISQVPSCATDSGFADQPERSDTSESSAGGSSFLSSVSSLITSPKMSAASVTQGSSTSMIAARSSQTPKAASDSLLPRKGGVKGRAGKIRLGLTILFSAQDSSSTSKNFRNLLLYNYSLVEVFLQHLQFQVLQAFYRGSECITLLRAAFADFQKNCANVWTLSALKEPAWMAVLNSNTDISDKFVSSFVDLASKFDTKLTQFFFSSLLTAVLTYHVTWVHSFIGRIMLPHECHNRILILTQDFNLAEQFILVLSYFVRCPYALQLYDDVMVSRISKETPPKKKVSSSSMEIRNAAVLSVSVASGRRENEDVFESLRTAQSSTNGVESPSSYKVDAGNALARRLSQQPENLRYLRDYFDARYAAEKSNIKEEDFGIFKNAIMRGSFQELACYAKFTEERESDLSSSNSPSFFVGSIPENSSDSNGQTTGSIGRPRGKELLRVELPSFEVLVEKDRGKLELHSLWSCGNEGRSDYIMGRTLQALNSSCTGWLDEVRQDLCAAACLSGRASCVIANIDKSEVSILTYEMTSKLPLRLKESWSLVPMSGEVSCLVESTQTLWGLTNKSSFQCVDFIESRLGLLCKKSEELALAIADAVSFWNIDRITGLLGVEAQDLPLLLAASSIHSPHVTQMVGLSAV